MKLQCPHCGDSFTYAPETGGTVASCRHCGLAVQLPTVAQLAPEQRQELQDERQAALRREQQQAEKAKRKAEKERQREETRQQQAQAEAQAAQGRAVPQSPPGLPAAPSLVACPDCGQSVSPHATACPGCGRPMAAQTIEKASKTFKAMQLLGALLCMGGVAAMVVDLVNPYSSELTSLSSFGFPAALIGFSGFVLGRGLAYWFHG